MSHGSRGARDALGVCLVMCLLLTSVVIAADPDEMVAFNTKTLKFHCLSCQWAVKCTQNCVTIPRSEAIKRGGVPCKVCGGSCKKGTPE